MVQFCFMNPMGKTDIEVYFLILIRFCESDEEKVFFCAKTYFSGLFIDLT